MKRKLHQSLIVTLVTMLLALTASSASAQTTYNLWIAGVQVTSANCGDLTVIPGVTGTVSYNPDTQTLTLDDATINGNLVIYTPLTCVVKGYVSITATGDAQAIGIFRDAVIKGDGELTLKSQKNSGIYTEASLVINRCTVSVEGTEGITGYEGTHRESLAIKNASVTVKGREGSICNLASFTLEGGCKIAKPAGAVWNDTKHAVCDAAGNVIKGEVVIMPVEEYGLQIAGVEVTSANCKDLSVIPGVTGKVSYDPASHTLSLQDATVEYEDGSVIKADKELTCIVKGEVSVVGIEDPALSFAENAIIKGDGKLKAESFDSFGIYPRKGLNIDGCTVHAEGKWGIAGDEGDSSASLTIKNATVTAQGAEGSICDLASLTLEGCEITKPAGAVWNADKHAVCDASGNVIKDEVVIAPKEEGGTAIDFVTPEQRPADGAVYDMNGVLRSEPLEELPTGVYIVGGRKVMHVQR